MSPRTRIRPVEASDEEPFLDAVRRSRSLHEPWVSPPATPERFAAYIRWSSATPNQGFVVTLRSSSELVGVVNISNIVLGVFRSGYLDYYAFTGFERQGLMKEGLRSVVRHAFGKMRLHRLEANIQPENLASIALVKACGFQREGYSPRYLKIRGRWRDHERWAIVAR